MTRVLPGARAGEDEERPLLVEDGLALFGIETGSGSRRGGHQDGVTVEVNVDVDASSCRRSTLDSYSTVTDLARLRG